MRDRKKNKRKEKTVPVRFPQKQIEKKTERNHQQRQRPQTAPLQHVPLGSRYPWGLNLLSLNTAAGKEVTKEGRDGSGLGAREGLGVRDVLHVHALQVRILWRTETKKQRIDLILGVPIRISLGAKLAALKTFYGWVVRVAIVCIHVDECPARHRHQEERRGLRLAHDSAQVAGAALRGRTTRSLHKLRAGNCGIRICARSAVCALVLVPA